MNNNHPPPHSQQQPQPNGNHKQQPRSNSRTTSQNGMNSPFETPPGGSIFDKVPVSVTTSSPGTIGPIGTIGVPKQQQEPKNNNNAAVNGNNIVLNSTSDSKSVSPINNNNNTNKISPVPENAQERSTSNDNVQEKAIFDLVDSS